LSYYFLRSAFERKKWKTSNVPYACSRERGEGGEEELVEFGTYVRGCLSVGEENISLN